ncbi:hypothetical protein [uncultured Sphingomonas sp.]|uniref:hypothetical protein n=1 Tax=uncultured Sphingomonas sp. TaxID=158754 RepID=UPI0035C9E8B9
MSIAHAAREAGIDPASAHHARKRDAAFAAAWTRAREKGVVCLTQGEPRLAPTEVVRASKDGRLRITRAGPGRWSRAREELFLETLRATANVSAACRAAGVSNAAVYTRRARWPGFAAHWAEALEQGYHRLEALLVENATIVLDPGRGDDVVTDAAADGKQPAFVSPMTVDQAITVFRMHQARVTGEGRRGRHDWRRETSMADVRAEILKRLKALKG